MIKAQANGSTGGVIIFKRQIKIPSDLVKVSTIS